MIKKLNSFQLLKNVSGEKISLTSQRSKFFHMIKTKFFRIHAGKKNMAAENVVNDTENKSYNLSTLAIFHAVQAAQGQLQQQNMNADVPFIGNDIPAINRDHDFHKKVSDSQLDTEDQVINESQILLQSLQGNSVLLQQDQLSSLAFSTTRSLDGVTMDFSREDGMPTSTSDLLQRLLAEVQSNQCIWNKQSSE